MQRHAFRPRTYARLPPHVVCLPLLLVGILALLKSATFLPMIAFVLVFYAWWTWITGTLRVEIHDDGLRLRLPFSRFLGRWITVNWNDILSAKLDTQFGAVAASIALKTATHGTLEIPLRQFTVDEDRILAEAIVDAVNRQKQ